MTPVQQSLFSVSDIDTDVVEHTKEQRKSVRQKAKVEKKVAKINHSIDKAIGKLEEGTVTQFVSKAEWSTHDLLYYILDQSGPANVWIATWSVTSPVVAKIANLIEEGMITGLRGVFDWRMKQRCPEAHQFMKYQCSDIRLINCHAKVTVIQNEKMSITIVGSANLTNNPRIESGVIFTDKETAEFNKEWIEGELKNGAYFE